MKRSAIFVLVFSVLVAIVCPVAAIAVPMSYDYTDESIRVDTQESFYALFTAEKIDKIRYSYTVSQRIEDQGVADVDLSFELQIGLNTYHADIIGQINSCELPSITLWEGSLDGSIAIDGIEYLMIVGFFKTDASANVQCSVTIQPPSLSDLNSIVAFTFGDTVLTKEIREMISTNSSTITPEQTFIDKEIDVLKGGDVTVNGIGDVVIYDPVTGGMPSIGANNEWDFVKQGFSKFTSDSGISGWGLQTRAYFWPEDNALALLTYSYCDAIDEYWESSVFSIPTTYIHEYSVSLAVGEKNGTNNSRIDGMEDITIGNSSYSQSFMTLIDDALSLLNFPTNTVSAIIGSLVAYIDTTVDSAQTPSSATVSVRFSWYSQANFDAIASGVPFIYYLEPSNTNSYTGGSIYNTTTTIKYRTELYDTITCESAYYFYYANDIDMTLTLDLNST